MSIISPVYDEHEIRSVAELLAILPEIYKKSKTVWFRGHANHEWHLEPTLARRNKLSAELQLMTFSKPELNHAGDFREF